jgi:hypothetical protein
MASQIRRYISRGMGPAAFADQLPIGAFATVGQQRPATYVDVVLDQGTSGAPLSQIAGDADAAAQQAGYEFTEADPTTEAGALVQDVRYFRTATLNLLAGQETILAWDSQDGGVTGMSLSSGDVLWSGGSTTLHGHLSLTYQGVTLLSSMRVRVYRVRGGVATALEDQAWGAGLLSAGPNPLPDMAVRVPVVSGDRVRVTIQPTTAGLAVPLVLGALATHLDLHAGGAG